MSSDTRNKNTEISLANIHQLKLDIRNRRSYEIWPKSTIKITERRKWRHLCIFIVNFEYISYVFLALFCSPGKSLLGNNITTMSTQSMKYVLCNSGDQRKSELKKKSIRNFGKITH